MLSTQIRFQLGERMQSQMAQDPVNTGPYLFLSFTPVSPSANLLCHLYTLLRCTSVVPLNMNLNVSTGINFADTQNLMSLRMSFDGVTSLIFSSPEPLGSQGELIVYPSSRRPSVVHHFQISSSLKPLGQSKPNFMWSLLGKGERKFI